MDRSRATSSSSLNRNNPRRLNPNQVPDNSRLTKNFDHQSFSRSCRNSSSSPSPCSSSSSSYSSHHSLSSLSSNSSSSSAACLPRLQAA